MPVTKTPGKGRLKGHVRGEPAEAGPQLGADRPLFTSNVLFSISRLFCQKA